MSAQIATLQRQFNFKDVELPDPDPTMTPVEVIEFYSGKYPELTVATIKEPTMDGDILVYDLEYSVGNKA